MKITPIKSAVFQIKGGVSIAAGENIMAKVEKNLLEKFGQERIRQKKYQWEKARKKKKISREKNGEVYVPQHVVLSESGMWDWQYSIYRQGYPDVYKHIVGLLDKYVDALKKTQDERQEELKQIADQITTQLIDNKFVSSLFSVGDIPGWPMFFARLIREKSADEPSPGKRIWTLLPKSVQSQVDNLADNSIQEEDKSNIINALNAILNTPNFYQEQDFSNFTLPVEVQALLNRKREELSTTEVQKLNRLLIEAVYPHEMGKGLKFKLQVNEGFNPDTKNPYPAESVPFHLVPPGGVTGMYMSIARFFDSKYIHRIRRCDYCNGLFIAPDNLKYKFCPGTDHRNVYWEENRKKSGYHQKYMAEKRNPDSSKFDPKYIK